MFRNLSKRLFITLSIPSLLSLTIVLLPPFSIQGQKLSDEELYMNVWHITNVSLDSNTIFNQDTLILRQALRSGHKYYYDSITISPYDVWNISFGEYHDLTIYAVQRPPTGVIINHSEYYTEMYPCLNTVWTKNRKEINLKIGIQNPVKYYINQYSNLELTLIKKE